MTAHASHLSSRTIGQQKIYLAGVTLIILCGAMLRLRGLGARSLWLDEFCTWHVSRIPLRESLRWPPELTKPPLYQFCLRMLTRESRPPEWLLRLPAAVFGTLTIAAGAWLAGMLAGRSAGLALAALLACNPLQLDYSQEARPYSLLVLGCALSVACWYRLVTCPRRRLALLYVAATAMAFHAHYAAVLTILAEVTWWLLSWQRLSMRPWKLPAISLCATGALCAPVIVNYLWQRASLFQGLSWIPATTWSGALSVLAQSSGGLAWVYAVLPAALALWLWGTWRRTNGGQGRLAGRIRAAPEGGHALLALWLVGAWVGLLAISWLVKPAMIARYALPSAVPALLLPLAVAARLHARAPLVLALVFVAARAPDWLRHGSETPPGFREMIEYLNAHAEPRTAGVAILIDEVTHPGWADMQRLGFDYYPLRDLPVYDLTLSSGGAPSNEALLADPRTLYVVAFLGDPLPLIHTAGRTIRPFQIDGASYTQLLFTPYRLVQVAPLASAMAPSGGAGHAPSSVFARGSPVDGGVGSGSAIR